ncbi:MAG: glutamate formimidoyltransferase, partial [Candidatus Neomarinimicrobiota bacterium]
MSALVECVPNFSEGRDRTKIDTIVRSIESVSGVTLLDVDPGRDTNRTVVTFVGEPAAVAEAAYQGIKTAAEILDMRSHSGAHPRMGATDVCPFIPVADSTVEECVALSRQVAERVGTELKIPVFLYEYSATRPERRNLAVIREGEYEGMDQKLRDSRWTPDFGPAALHPQAGVTAIGCRDFLIAYNINLNTRDVRLATDIAFELREKGRSKRIPDPASPNLLDGTIVRYGEDHWPCSFCEGILSSRKELEHHARTDHDRDLVAFWRSYGYDPEHLVGKAVKVPGRFPHVKAIGWYIDTFKRAQISINFTRFRDSTIHDVFDAACELAAERGIRVTGSELVGLIPLEAILLAGNHYLRKQGRS